MKWTLYLVLGLCAVALHQVNADETDDIPSSEFDGDFDESDLKDLEKLEAESNKKDIHRENDLAAKFVAESLANGNDVAAVLIPEADPCDKMHCGAGRVCVHKGESAECACIEDCPVESEIRRHVCTNYNETWTSDCEVYKQRCLCDTGHLGCKDQRFKHLHVEYYGVCKDLPACSSEEMIDFPRRMRDWLFNVMSDLAERDELTEHYMKMVVESEAETNMTRRWANAAIWKWCDLDNDTDRSVSRHELFPIRAPLVSLEHCIAPFLDSCDKNNDHRISLKEWGRCLELDVDDIKERCDDIQKHIPHLLG